MPIKFHEEMEKYLALRKRRLFLKSFSAGVWTKAVASSHKLSSKASGYLSAIKSTFKRKHDGHVQAASDRQSIDSRSLEHVVEQKIAEVQAKNPASAEKEVHQAALKIARPKKTFGSFLKTLGNFVSIRTVTEIEEERKKAEGERAVKEYLEVKQMMGNEDFAHQESAEPIAVAGTEGESLSSYFPSSVSAAAGKMREEADEVIELDKGYKIRVIRNK